jgi:hypothetical protein
MVTRSKPASRKSSASGLEINVVSIADTLSGFGNRSFMEIDTEEAAFGEGIRHDQGRGPMPAAKVGDPGARFKLLENAVKRGKPLRNKVRFVTWPEEALCPAKQAVTVIAPANTIPRAECLGELRLVGVNRCQRHETATHKSRAFFIRKNCSLFQRKPEGCVFRIVSHEAGGRLRGKPLRYVSFMRAGRFGKPGGVGGPSASALNSPSLSPRKMRTPFAAVPSSLTTFPSNDSSFEGLSSIGVPFRSLRSQLTPASNGTNESSFQLD